MRLQVLCAVGALSGVSFGAPRLLAVEPASAPDVVAHERGGAGDASVREREPAGPPLTDEEDSPALPLGNVLRPTLLGEVDYRVYPAEEEGQTGFGVARFRPGLVLTPVDWMRAVGTVEFAGEYAVIQDLFAQAFVGEFEFTAGYAKPLLFASFAQEPVHTLPMPDRAPVVRSFAIDRDVGVTARYRSRSAPLELALRVGNGSGSPLGNDNAIPAGYASADLVLGRANLQNRTAPAGLRFGAAGLVESVRDRNGISGSTPLGFVYFRPVVVSGLRAVLEAHAIVYWSALRFTVEGAVAEESRSRDDDGNPNTDRVPLDSQLSAGLTTELVWTLFGGLRVPGRIPRGRIAPRGRWGGGALELAGRYDRLWLGRGASDITPGGADGGAVVLKWWPTSFLAATLAGSLTHYDVPPIEEPDQSWSWGVITRASFFWGIAGPRAR